MDTIDIKSSDNNARVGVSFADERFWFYPRWNQRENEGVGAWFIDIREEDNTLVAGGIKLVLGTQIGRRNSHDFFKKHTLHLVDLSNSGTEAGFDDLGQRVVLLHVLWSEFKRPLGV